MKEQRYQLRHDESGKWQVVDTYDGRVVAESPYARDAQEKLWAIRNRVGNGYIYGN